jgi:hypothetical protein
MTFKEYIKAKKNKKKKSPLPQTDKSSLISSDTMIPTHQLPAGTGANQPHLS